MRNRIRAEEDQVMSRTKRASKGKGSRKALTVLSVAGMSLAATTSGAVAEISPQVPAPLHAAPLYEEEIFDVSLATFHLFDQERAGANDPLMKYAHGGCGGCGGCGHGCGGGGGCHGCGGGGGCHGCAGGMHGCAGGMHGCAGHGCRGMRGCRGGCGWGGWWGGCGGCDWCLSWGGCNPWC